MTVMQFTFVPTRAKGLDDFLARSAHHLSTLSATGRSGWFASWLPAVRGWKLQGELDAFTKNLVLMTLERWAGRCEVGDQASGSPDEATAISATKTTLAVPA